MTDTSHRRSATTDVYDDGPGGSAGCSSGLVVDVDDNTWGFRVRAETGASAVVLSLAISSAAVVLVTFAFTTLIHEPASVITLLAILLLSIALGVGWKRTEAVRTRPAAPAHQTRHGVRLPRARP